MDYLKSEHLKFKRTISNKLIFIVPLITAIFAWLMGGYMGYQYMTLYWWYAFLLPGGIAILCSLSHRKEENWICPSISIFSRFCRYKNFLFIIPSELQSLIWHINLSLSLLSFYHLSTCILPNILHPPFSRT